MTRQQLLEEQETKVIAALEDPAIAAQLLPVTEKDIAPGLVLIYKLGQDYGCHIVRSRQDAVDGSYRYKPGTELREGIKAGNFFTLPDNVKI